MKQRNKIWIVFFVFGLSSLSYGQVTLDDVLKKYVEGIGEERKLNQLQCLKIEQLSYQSNMEIPQTLYIVNKKAFYQESLMPKGRVVVAIKDEKGWMLNPYVSSKAVDLSEAQQMQFLYQANVFSPLYDYYKQNEDKSKIKEIILLKETEQVDWNTCYVVLLTYTNDFEEKLFLDAKTFSLRKIKNMFGEVLLSNYKVTAGLSFPMSKEFIGANKLVNKIEIVSIAINPVLDEALFKKPD